MQLLDRIEKRRFVGREFLLWLWFESELFEASLQTPQHGLFALWVEKRLVLSGAGEATRVAAPRPGLGREAKEALLRGQLPESACLRVAWGRAEVSFALDAEKLAISALKLPRVTNKLSRAATRVDESGTHARADVARAPARGALDERMRVTGALEQLLDTLYGDFLLLRLSPAWRELVVPLLASWARGEELDLEPYEALRRPPSAQSDVIELSPAEAEELVELVDDAEPLDDPATHTAFAQ